MTANGQRAICAACGHTYECHDRDSVRARERSDPGVDRPCYRMVGATACRCDAFRDSGDVAVARRAVGGTPTSRRVITNAVPTLLLVVMGRTKQARP